MSDTLSATEARIHFGELIRNVVKTGRHVIVERAGKPQVVVMSIDAFERLRASNDSQSQLDALERRLFRLATPERPARPKTAGPASAPVDQLAGPLEHCSK